ncbi:hypothetical protein NE237_028441 [Protea cynaroides]|uniref:Uncharacterized protein n=1 Tax=Protea cynaroides TaxID=273540 RepID=A0A9Q0GTT6_9MAGN|nr:hypothetical protein NE237_028441 [Protea cynaroides]
MKEEELKRNQIKMPSDNNNIDEDKLSQIALQEQAKIDLNYQKPEASKALKPIVNLVQSHLLPTQWSTTGFLLSYVLGEEPGPVGRISIASVEGEPGLTEDDLRVLHRLVQALAAAEQAAASCWSLGW